MSIQTVAVHTTGINWESVLVIAGTSSTLLTILGGIVGRYVSNCIATAITEFQISVVSALRDRLTALEAKIDTIDANNPKRR